MNSLDIHIEIQNQKDSCIKQDSFSCVMDNPYCECEKRKVCQLLPDVKYDKDGYWY